MVRAFICPVVGTGAKGDAYRSKVADYGYPCASFIPSSAPNGSPASPWALTVLLGSDFTPLEADATCDDLFAGALPASINTRGEVRDYLRATTVGDVPLARRTAITAVLDKYAIPRDDFTAGTPLWRVLQRVVSTLYRAAARERDDSFPAFL